MRLKEMTEPYFIFKGINSKSMRLLISSMPNIIKPKRRTTTITIPGRNGSETEDSGTYEGYTLSVGCGVENITQAELDKLWEWLDGSGDLILSTEPSKVYKARIDGEIALSDMYWVFQNFLIQFDVEPFKYSVNAANDFMVMTKRGTLYNRGTYYSEPIIKLYGSDTLSININGTDYSCENVSDYVTINTPMQMVYRGGVNMNSQYLARKFPTLLKGENTIYFSSNVIKAEIEPNWRWL